MVILGSFFEEQEIIGARGNKHHIPSVKRVWGKFFERRTLAPLHFWGRKG
jgi:hypothetical protein